LDRTDRIERPITTPRKKTALPMLSPLHQTYAEELRDFHEKILARRLRFPWESTKLQNAVARSALRVPCAVPASRSAEPVRRAPGPLACAHPISLSGLLICISSFIEPLRQPRCRCCRSAKIFRRRKYFRLRQRKPHIPWNQIGDRLHILSLTECTNSFASSGGGYRSHAQLMRAMGVIRKAGAIACRELNLFAGTRVQRIKRASREVMEGNWHKESVADV